mmetsp:Transcript_67077/g.212298  ORF Transcript_67077/g.212298 Transcript_67077/m.212298 type:complete len:340 (-) Transcript_67077:165-1184(-)
MRCTSRVHARIGLMGNPSDGFYGKTVAVSVENFWAEVELEEAEKIEFIPNPEHDPSVFASLEGLAAHVSSRGYYGGVRLLMATCKRFFEHCAALSPPLLPTHKNFSLRYSTNIPRQAGLSGSSAIVCAALNCLMEYYGVSIPKEQQPTLVLSAERELGITAGLQDRVIQVYGGAVFMDFDEQQVKSTGCGFYTPLDPGLLPPLWLVYADNPSDSGKVHSDVRRRYDEGDAGVRGGMADVAQQAELAREALEAGDVGKLAAAMDRNFDLRRSMFGDQVLGELNLKMISTARSVGAAAKFTGSGGAIVALCPEGDMQAERLKAACGEAGFTIVPVRVAPPR